MSTTLPHAFIVDLDNTLSLLGDRDPYDASRCDLDSLNAPMADMLLSLQHCHPGYQTILITSRPEKHRTPTETFLTHHHIRCDYLFMRDDDDWTPCAFYKWNIYHKYIKDRFTIHAAFDDNEVVCRMFAQEGIPIYQVTPQPI